MKVNVILTFIFSYFASTNCARILGFFSTPSLSHQVVYHALIKDLAFRGHHVTVLTTDLMDTKNPNITQINLHAGYETFQREFSFVMHKEIKTQEIDLMEIFLNIDVKLLEEQLSHPEVKKLIADEKQSFDVLIIEYMYYFPALAFAERFNCPIIGISSFDSLIVGHEDLGNVMNPAIHPEVLFPYPHAHLSFTERWESISFYLRVKYLLLPKYEQKCDEIVRKHFPKAKKSVHDLRQKIDLLMTNTSPVMGFLRPILPNTIQLGFMHIEPPKPLRDESLQRFLDNSKNGVIYMSLGSNVKSKELSPEIISVFLNVFKNLNYDVLWKFEDDSLPNKPKNVMISKWFQQSDLLAHPKIKFFITQGGQQSMEEAIDRVVPMIVLPFLGDQDVNAKRMVAKNIAVPLELHTLNEDILKSAINEILKSKYRNNVQNLRTLIYDEPMTSRERAVWWTEYVIRNKGAEHLKYPGLLVPFYQKYWLDFIGIGIILLLVTFIVLKKISRKVFGTIKTKQE